MMRYKKPTSSEAAKTLHRRAASRAQCLAWASGRSYHDHINDECTPDFSCCQPDCFETDEDKRWATYREQHGLNS